MEYISHLALIVLLSLPQSLFPISVFTLADFAETGEQNMTVHSFMCIQGEQLDLPMVMDPISH